MLHMKKVLFIAYLYPPIANSGTRRSLEFANHLPDFDWEPIVLTVANPPIKSCDLSLLDEVSSTTRIERISLGSDLISEYIADLCSPFVDRSWVAEGLKYRIQGLWQIPDECVSWWPAAIRRGEDIYKNESFDLIYATGWPWTSFLIAKEISRKTGVPYVVDYRDLWKQSDAEWDTRPILDRWFSPSFERSILHKAAAVVSTTPSFVQELESAGGKGKSFCITNGFNPNDYVNALIFDPENGDNIVSISYTGVWRSGYNPEDLYLAVRYLKDINSKCLLKFRVVMAGFKPGKAQEHDIADIVSELGFVPHDHAISIMMSSNALYLPVSSGQYEMSSIPGKLFEYIGSGRPILASVLPGSEVASVLDSVGGAHSITPGNVLAIAEFIERMCDEGREIFSIRDSSAIAQYTRNGLTKKLAKLFDSVIEDRSQAPQVTSDKTVILKA
jgi:hypothetical protein